MDLKKDLKKILIKGLTQFGVNPNKSSNIKELLRQHFNLQAKMIRQRPRKIHKSKTFEKKEQSLDKKFKAALDGICEKLETGRNVNAHLSKNSTKLLYNDLLLNEWGIHHLHISNTKKKSTNKSYDRSKWLFFAIIKLNDVYLIDIYLHQTPNVWAKSDLLKQIKINWPEILEPFKLNGVLGSSHTCDDKDRIRLREVCCNTFIEIDDEVFAPPGGGISTAGTNINHTEDTINLLLKLKKYEQLLTEEDATIKAHLKKQGIDIKGDIDFELFVDDKGGLLVREKTSKATINFN